MDDSEWNAVPCVLWRFDFFNVLGVLESASHHQPGHNLTMAFFLRAKCYQQLIHKKNMFPRFPKCNRQSTICRWVFHCLCNIFFDVHNVSQWVTSFVTKIHHLVPVVDRFFRADCGVLKLHAWTTGRPWSTGSMDRNFPSTNSGTIFWVFPSCWAQIKHIFGWNMFRYFFGVRNGHGSQSWP